MLLYYYCSFVLIVNTEKKNTRGACRDSIDRGIRTTKLRGRRGGKREGSFAVLQVAIGESCENGVGSDLYKGTHRIRSLHVRARALVLPTATASDAAFFFFFAGRGRRKEGSQFRVSKFMVSQQISVRVAVDKNYYLDTSRTNRGRERGRRIYERSYIYFFLFV